MVEKDINNFWLLNWLDEFLIGHKGFICGGCFKNIFNHEKVKDLDMFFRCSKDWEDAVQYYDSMTPGYEGEDKRAETYYFYYENENVKAYKHIEKGTVIELCCKSFGTPKEIIDNFDFTVTKFAFYKEEVEDENGEKYIENKIICDDKFFEHLHLKRLVVDNKIPFPMGTFERMLRYAKYGFFPCRETKMKIIQAIRKLPEAKISLPEVFYEGWD